MAFRPPESLPPAFLVNQDWRVDAEDFPREALGCRLGWPGEKWIDFTYKEDEGAEPVSCWRGYTPSCCAHLGLAVFSPINQVTAQDGTIEWYLLSRHRAPRVDTVAVWIQLTKLACCLQYASLRPMTRLPPNPIKVVYEIMRARIRKAIDLGCDGIEPDNMSVS